jgi:hypothetical protein
MAKMRKQKDAGQRGEEAGVQETANGNLLLCGLVQPQH